MTVEDHWSAQYANEAAALGFEIAAADEAVARVHANIDEIDRAP